MKNIISIILIFVCVMINLSHADQINDYKSKITILEDGTIDVVETIQISTNHEEIRLGITRDIPAYYYFMNKYVETPVKVLSVTRNGQPENFWTENNDNYVEIFTGSVDNVVDNYLDKGKHTFVLHWQSKNHIRSFENYDELYFNAIGHNWRLPILNAMVTLHLPNSVKEIQSFAYYGADGAKDLGEVIVKSPQDIQFIAPSVLGDGRGFTIATGFTKGIIPSIQPSSLDILVDHFYGKLPGYIHPFNLVLFVMMFVLLLYYFIVKSIHTSLSPQVKRAFTVRFDPPTAPLSELFAVIKPDNDETERGVLAILLNMHVKGLISINQDAKSLTLGEQANQPLQDLEKPVMSAIKKEKIGLSFEKYNKPWIALLRILRSDLSSKNEKCYQEKMKWAWIGVFPLMIGIIAISVAFLFIPIELFFSLIFMGIALQALLIPYFYSIYQKVQLNGLLKTIPTMILRIPFLIFGLVFVTVPFFVIFNDAVDYMDGRDMLVVYLFVVLTLLVIRKFLMKIYAMIYVLSKKYGDISQEIMEFKHFLQYTKYEEYKIITPDLFEQYLPYSIILGIENIWVKRFRNYYPVEFAESSVIALSQSSNSSFSQSVSNTSTSTSSHSYGSGGFGSGGSGSGGGGSSGGGSGGGGGGGR